MTVYSQMGVVTIMLIIFFILGPHRIFGTGKATHFKWYTDTLGPRHVWNKTLRSCRNVRTLRQHYRNVLDTSATLPRWSNTSAGLLKFPKDTLAVVPKCLACFVTCLDYVLLI